MVRIYAASHLAAIDRESTHSNLSTAPISEVNHMSHFETNPKSLKDLLTQINMGELALPDFQRNFVWDPSATEELIESIMRKYPAGSLLFLKHDGTGFEVREFEGAPKLGSKT